MNSATTAQRRPFRIFNDAGATIPAYSIAKVKAGAAAKVVNGTRFVTVEKPDGESGSYVLTPPKDIENQKYGHCSPGSVPGWVTYDGTAPSVGDEVGPEDDKWTVNTDGSGFIVWDVDTDETLVLVEWSADVKKTLICRPKADVASGEAMICDVQEGPILLETDTGETIIAVNGGSLIAADTRCEAVHYSMRKGGERHPLSGGEVSSLISIDSGAVSSTTATQYADYELFSLEC